MNERIKKLWDQAAELEPGTSWEGQTKFMEKFAELIVGECSDVAYRFDGLTLGQGYTVSKHIRKQFGIEE